MRRARGIALELGEQRAQRVAAVQLVGAVGRDDEDALVPQAAREEDEECPGRAIGPVDVLEHERERPLAAELLEQREQRLEQARLAERRLVGPQLLGAGGRGARTELGEEGGELGASARGELVEDGIAFAGERAQHAHDRCVGQLLVAELDALADLHATARLPRPPRELGQEAGLAYARFTRDEGQGWVSSGRVAEGGFELRELGHAPDEPAARHTCRHDRSIHRGGGRVSGGCVSRRGPRGRSQRRGRRRGG